MDGNRSVKGIGFYANLLIMFNYKKNVRHRFGELPGLIDIVAYYKSRYFLVFDDPDKAIEARNLLLYKRIDCDNDLYTYTRNGKKEKISKL